MARFNYGGVPYLGGPAFPDDDDELLRKVQLAERPRLIREIYQRCRERYLAAERVLDRRTVLGLLAAGEMRPPDGALLEIHDTLAAGYRKSKRIDRLARRGATPAGAEAEAASEWIGAALDEMDDVLAKDPSLSHHLLIASVHSGSDLGERAEDVVATALWFRYGFGSDFPGRVTEVR